MATNPQSGTASTGSRTGHVLSAAVFVLGLVIVVVSAVGMVAPSVLLRVASRFDHSAAWVGMAIVRLSVAALLFTAAKGSRAPMLLRVVACVPPLAGLGALATPMVGVDRAQAAIAAWSRPGDGVVRLTGVVWLALGGAMAYPCAPGWRRLGARPRIEPGAGADARCARAAQRPCRSASVTQRNKLHCLAATRGKAGGYKLRTRGSKGTLRPCGAYRSCMQLQ